MKIIINNKEKETYEIYYNKLIRSTNKNKQEWNITKKLSNDLLQVFKNYCGEIYEGIIIDWTFTFFTTKEINSMVKYYDEYKLIN